MGKLSDLNHATFLPIPPPLPHPYAEQTFIHYRSRPTRKHCRTFSSSSNRRMDLLFDEGYRADVAISTDDGAIIYAHASILGVSSPVMKTMLRKPRRMRGDRIAISIHGVPSEAVSIFVRFLYSSCYEEDKLREHILSLLVLSHSYAIPQLKRECERLLEDGMMTVENVIDVFQLALLCDAPRLSLMSHRFILRNIKPVSLTQGWIAMRNSHPVLEKHLVESVIDETFRQKEKARKMEERSNYLQLYEAMEALVHIYKEGCRTIGPLDKSLKEDQETCKYGACKGLESLIRHFAACKMRVPGGCIRCKRMWQVFELHSRLCADSDNCKVPLCRYTNATSYHYLNISRNPTISLGF
ncbi:PREDICTED: BTB/POZ and TAZ domain-containing protein 4-like isoform X2 [Ipomoea nil]|uniref:BTB/POZ and TAZ domain-containing protein 4-like isoform X2 n=1 Tax=Ipomoea nil TaxID=35883 RepID=UPI0009012519|nr:PREDICTED: BTB/POZ and TAZ domain-containing protein 4-like isoform X2 [Ipomoea nil]